MESINSCNDYEKIIYSKDILSAIYLFDKVNVDEIFEVHWGEYLPIGANLRLKLLILQVLLVPLV